MKTALCIFAIITIVNGMANHAHAEPANSGKICNIDVEKVDGAKAQISSLGDKINKGGCVEGDILKVYGLVADPLFTAGIFCYFGHQIIQTRFGLLCTLVGTARTNRMPE